MPHQFELLQPNRPRLNAIDLLRGLAMLWMTGFHFCFDLNHAGFLQQNFYSDPFWTWQRNAIVSLFLLCAGVSQAVAMQQGQSWARFARRWCQIALCALLVSLGSWWMFPQSFIYFGVLHGIAVMLIIVRLTAAWGAWLWLLGGLAIATKFIAAYAHSAGFAGAFLNEKTWSVLGLFSVKPITEDYVPLVPWLGVVWLGLALGQWLLAQRPQWLQLALPAAAQPIVWLGRWSLSYYMLHQSVLIGLLSAYVWLRA